MEVIDYTNKTQAQFVWVKRKMETKKMEIMSMDNSFKKCLYKVEREIEW